MTDTFICIYDSDTISFYSLDINVVCLQNLVNAFILCDYLELAGGFWFYLGYDNLAPPEVINICMYLQILTFVGVTLILLQFACLTIEMMVIRPVVSSNSAFFWMRSYQIPETVQVDLGTDARHCFYKAGDLLAVVE